MNTIVITPEQVNAQRIKSKFDFALPAVNDRNIHNQGCASDDVDILPPGHLDPMLMSVGEIEESINAFKQRQHIPQASFLLGIRYAKISCHAAGVRI